MVKTNLKLNQSGFTLMEIVIATAIFATVVASILGLFNKVLQINRKVQATRQVAQASRNFTEILSREIRNGRIDYPDSGPCEYGQYRKSDNQVLAIVTYTGDRLCFYYDKPSQSLILQRQTATSTTTESINPSNLTINNNSFRFIVRPSSSPLSDNQGIQPMVTIIAQFEIYKGQSDQVLIPYQTTISTDVYDIPHK